MFLVLIIEKSAIDGDDIIWREAGFRHFDNLVFLWDHKLGQVPFFLPVFRAVE